MSYSLQALMAARDDRPAHWLTVPPLVSRRQLLADTHASLGHCGRDKLFQVVRTQFWWPCMFADVTDCVRQCATCQREKPRGEAREELRFIDKGSAPFVGWSIDTAGPFPADEDGNRYVIVAVDPFCKLTSVYAVIPQSPEGWATKCTHPSRRWRSTV